MSANVTLQTVAYCNECAEAPDMRDEPYEWAEEHNREHHPEAAAE